MCKTVAKAESLYKEHQEKWDAQVKWFKEACDPENLDNCSDDQRHVRILLEDLWSSGKAQELCDGKPSQKHVGPLWSAMVTRTLHPADPLCRSEPAHVALDAELSRLRAITTWDEENALEKERAKQLYPNAHFAKIFAIYGIKHSELEEKDQKWKARVVFGGNNIRTATNDWAVFADAGTVPSNMITARACLATSCLFPGMRRLQSDCIQAFTQAEMDPNLPTFISLPKAWWPLTWATKFKEPVCRLKLALYGHPLSGDIWATKLHDILIDVGFTCIEGWPSVYYMRVNVAGNRGLGELGIILVYVDDLLIFGGLWMDPILARIRKVVKMEDPTELARYLGCGHSVKVAGTSTFISFEMESYLRSAIDIYKRETGLKTVPRATPFPADLDQASFLKSVGTPGRWGGKAASFLMKLMY
ncbi:MAG: hypothetical protein MK213_03055, partial [Planctomycetes bacterium]|nr:hypothetical protein [Planctomycetota bacterium]